METKIVKVLGKNYKVLPSIGGKNGECTGCASYAFSQNLCGDFTKDTEDSCSGVIFQEVTEVISQTKPTIQMNLELDLSNCILPVFFTVKNLRLVSLDTALKNQSDAYNISVKDLPQETIEMLAEELKAEFIRRNTKVQA
jgi:hypothetical protein